MSQLIITCSLVPAPLEERVTPFEFGYIALVLIWMNPNLLLVFVS
jgi:hypothetical protein